jgi:hypothetical protein
VCRPLMKQHAADEKQTDRPAADGTRSVPAAGNEFACQAAEAQPGYLREFVQFMMHSKKWWLAPIIVILLLVGLLLILGGTAAAPFIYTLF